MQLQPRRAKQQACSAAGANTEFYTQNEHGNTERWYLIKPCFRSHGYWHTNMADINAYGPCARLRRRITKSYAVSALV